ncbi:hypothetical protein [Micromonospora maritima]|uniref:hypothetical protein n=1 Tax=Micromonospora maritima TaxID=986711 RepID=UPI00157BDFC9|nr:hypothetical protein [Micromonospora maritima]
MARRPAPVPPHPAAPPPRPLLARVKALPLPGFVLVYLTLYCALLGVGTVVSYRRLADDPSVEGFVVEAALAAAYIGLASVLPFAAALAALFLLRDVGPVCFRAAAVVLCCLPSVCTPEPGQLAYYLPIQVLVALLVRQPYDPDRDRVGVRHDASGSVPPPIGGPPGR